MSYSCKIENEADFAKARVEGVNASYKDLAEVCYNIRRRPADVAVQILEDAKDKKMPLRYHSHNTRMAHRKELQGQKGRWPIKCAAIVLKCLQSAIANAKEKGLSEELIVSHASANKKHSYMRYSSKGRRNTSKLETARVEIVLREKIEGKKKRMADEKKAAEEKKKADTAKKAEEAKAAAAKPIEAKPGEIKPVPEAPKKENPLEMEDREKLRKRIEDNRTKTDLTVTSSIADSGEKVTTKVEKKTTPSLEVSKPVAKPPEVKKEEAKPKIEEKPAAKVEDKKAAPAEKPKEALKEMEPRKEEAKPAEAKEEKKEPPKAAPPKKEEKNEVA